MFLYSALCGFAEFIFHEGQNDAIKTKFLNRAKEVLLKNDQIIKSETVGGVLSSQNYLFHFCEFVKAIVEMSDVPYYAKKETCKIKRYNIEDAMSGTNEKKLCYCIDFNHYYLGFAKYLKRNSLPKIEEKVFVKILKDSGLIIMRSNKSQINSWLWRELNGKKEKISLLVIDKSAVDNFNPQYKASVSKVVKKIK